MSDSIIVRVTLDAYDIAHPSEKQTQVYVQIPEVARASWLLNANLYTGLKLSPWPNVVDAAIEDYDVRHVVANAASETARAAVRAWLRDAANRDEMQAAYEVDQARRNPITRKLLAENARLLDRVAELAEHGIAGSADALPVPVREEPQEDPVAAGRRLDLLALMDERAASAVSPVLAGVLDEAERLRASRWDATKVVAQMESKLLAMHGELTRATERVAELEAERHSTNESPSEAAETLRANRDRITELETEREKLVRWHGEDSEAITKLVARVERHRARLVALQNDALAMRGSLSPNGEDRKVPFPLGETLTPAVDWLINRVTELEVAAVEGRAALAAFCHDHQDPGTAALGALYLLQQATPGTPMEPGETVPKVYRASHDAIVMGLYTTAAAARAHCEAEERRSWGETSAPTNFDWIEDEEDGVAEMTAFVGGEERTTGYVVTPLEVAAAYDPDGDE